MDEHEKNFWNAYRRARATLGAYAVVATLGLLVWHDPAVLVGPAILLGVALGRLEALAPPR